MNLLEHKKARLNYEIIEEYEDGIELFGYEVKSLRAKLGSLEGSHVGVRPTSSRLRRGTGGGEAYIIGMSIPPYQAANAPKEYDRERSRRLLLTRKEISTLANFEGQKGLTIVPISVYNKGRNLKMRIAAVRGKKKYDKRQALKARDAKREIERSLKIK